VAADIGPGVLLDDRYRLDERVGAGGTATVYRGTDTVLHRQVAVKLFRPDGADATVARRRAREMRLTAAVSDPHLVTVYDAHPADPVPTTPEAALWYLVTEYVDGPTLADNVAGGPVAPEQLRSVGAGLARALAALHDHGLVHRDVKPGNILITSSGQPKLTDLGIAVELGGLPVTQDGMVVGTVPYLSPEQAQGDDVGPASDVYSLGLVLLECLNGHREFPGAPLESAVARLLRDPAVPPDLPPPWPDLLAAMTDRDPTRRPSAAQVAATLAADPADVTPIAQAERPPTTVVLTRPAVRAEPAKPRRRRWAVLATAVVAAAILGGWWVVGADNPAVAPPTTEAPTSASPPAAPPTPTATAPQPAADPATSAESTTTAAPPTSAAASSSSEPIVDDARTVAPPEPDPIDAPEQVTTAATAGNGNGGNNGNGNGNSNGNGNGNGNGNNGNGNGGGNNGNGNGNGGGNNGNGNGRG
jgi:serine/threonine protein kinase